MDLTDSASISICFSVRSEELMSSENSSRDRQCSLKNERYRIKMQNRSRLSIVIFFSWHLF